MTKGLVKKVIGDKNFLILKNWYNFSSNYFRLHYNFYSDLKLFYRHSHVFKTDNFNKIESELILDYHGVEKGFLHKKIRFRFAENRIKRMLKNLKQLSYDPKLSSQISIALKVLCDYYEFHQKKNIKIDDYFPSHNYQIIKSNLKEQEKIFYEVTPEEFFNQKSSSFPAFSDSRKSIRNFNSQLIEKEKMEAVISIAKNSPSVCNRQPVKVHFVQNQTKIKQILAIQGGLTGFTENLRQIIVLTSNRNYFFSVGERNQLYIDGGIFLMNLLYALHYQGIAACPANWGKEYKDDLKAAQILNLPASEKIICVVAVGYANNELKYTLSKRRSTEEILNIID